MEIPARMKMTSIRSQLLTILGALFLATLLTGCYDSSYGGPGYYGNSGYYGTPGYYGSSGYYGSPGYGGNTYYSKNVYRGYGSYPQPGLFGGYAPAHEAWDESSRGRTSYGGGEHGGARSGDRDTKSGEHSRERGGHDGTGTGAGRDGGDRDAH